MTIKEFNTEGNKLQNIWYLLNSQKNLGSIITDFFQECNGRSGGISQLTPYRLRYLWGLNAQNFNLVWQISKA